MHLHPQVVLALGLACAGSSQSGSETCARATPRSTKPTSAPQWPKARANSTRPWAPSASTKPRSRTNRPGIATAFPEKDLAYVMEFAKDALTAAKPLAYAIGSGTRAFSYLLQDDGFLYEAPVAYYAANHSWGLAPGYNAYSYPYLTRPIVPGCLTCHASGVQVAPPALNRYASPAFLEGGVACERCHGDGARHVAKMKSGDRTGAPEILQPADLPPTAAIPCAPSVISPAQCGSCAPEPTGRVFIPEPS